MSNDELVKALREAAHELLKAAESDRHKHLKSLLNQFADEQGFKKVFEEIDGKRPDALRTDEKEQYIFIGDAKVSENETPGNADTLYRIVNYMRSFKKWLERGKPGGYFAICTDDADAAEQWRTTLNLLAKEFGIMRPSALVKAPSFKVIDYRGAKVAFW